MIKVLFISAWYPNRYDAMIGLFVQKHAQAVAMYCDVRVLYVQPDEKITAFEITRSNKSGLNEIIVYYPVKEGKNINKIFKSGNFLKAYRIGFKQLRKEEFVPDIIHVNILSRTGLIAYLYKLWKGTPYVITEHWSRFLPGKKAFSGNLHKWLTIKIVKNASAVLPVSESLKNGMIANGLIHNNYKVLNNVVDKYFYEEKTAVLQSKKRILHISCFDEQAKNVCGILRSVKKLWEKRNDFELIVIGTGKDYQQTYDYSKTLNFPKGVIQFLGEKTPEEVADWYRNCDLFVLFSNYETAGIVIAESLVSGVPVISSKVGIAPELINAGNGILVETGNETQLTDALDEMLDNLPVYNKEKIKQNARELFSYQNIGEKITDIYCQILNK